MLVLKKHEILALAKTLLKNNPVIVEAGAFDGRDTRLLSETWPAATIHAFEPVPEIYALLQKNTQDLPNVHTYPVGLSDATGNALFYVSEKPSKPGKPFQAGSLLKPKERLKVSDVTYAKTMQVPVITLDDWGKQHGIDHVDFLWLDLQGMELNVIKASPKTISTAQAIYTEVEFIEAYEGQYLVDDVIAWMNDHGFQEVARDFADQKSWFFGNVLFSKK